MNSKKARIIRRSDHPKLFFVNAIIWRMSYICLTLRYLSACNITTSLLGFDNSQWVLKNLVWIKNVDIFNFFISFFFHILGQKVNDKKKELPSVQDGRRLR